MELDRNLYEQRGELLVMFYEYHQNNSFGYFEGLKTVIVEADSAEEADRIASENGVYFDGVASGIDCGCCGNRWYHAWGEGSDEPEIYGKKYNPVYDRAVVVYK